MRIAIIGNSHLWALKDAIRTGLFIRNEFEFTFWGTGGLGFDTITYEGGSFRTPLRDVVLKVSNGRYESLPAHEFDAIIFHGIFPNVGHYLSALQKMSDDIRRYSRAYLCDGLRACIEGEKTYPLVHSLRADYERRVLMSAVPLTPTAHSKERPIRREEFNLVDSCISAILSDMRAEYVAQPSETVLDYRFTKTEFVKIPSDDDIHMNRQYGAGVLREIAAQLSVR